MSFRTQNQTVRELLGRLRERSEYEFGHAQRVAVFSVAVGEALGLADGELRLLRYAAELHDLGKLEFSDRMLAGEPLEAGDAEKIRRHPQMVAGLLAPYPFLLAVLPAIEGHHERLDGSGYPYGLVGEAIPLGARIIAAAEAFDVAQYGSSYAVEREDPWPAVSGPGFDPRVVEKLRDVSRLVQPVGT